MGAKNSEVDFNTKNIFLEAAIFAPLAVRRSRREAGIDTDSSYRFERKVFAGYLEYASADAQSLILKTCGGAFSGYTCAGKKPNESGNKVKLNFNDLNAYFGEEFSPIKVKSILTNLGFEIKAPKSKTAVWEIEAPDFRLDIEREVDIYEEISRIYGYANFKNNIAFISAQDNSAPRDEVYQFKNQLRAFSTALGLKEIISFSIDNDEELAKLGYKDPIKLSNPLRSQENAMRPTLLTGMLKVCRHNLNRVAELSFTLSGLKLFEIANVYSRADKGFAEVPVLSIGLCSGDNSFARLKAIVQKIFIQYNVKNLEIKEEGLENFSNALKIYSGSKFIGFLGKLDTSVQKNYDLKEELFYAQLDVKALCLAKQSQAYCPFSAYPAVWRDISIVMKNELKFKEIEKIIKEKNKYLAGLKIMDTYRGKDIPQDSHAFTLRVIYQASDKTLTSTEVDTIHTDIRNSLSSQFGIILR